MRHCDASRKLEVGAAARQASADVVRGTAAVAAEAEVAAEMGEARYVRRPGGKLDAVGWREESGGGGAVDGGG